MLQIQIYTELSIVVTNPKTKEYRLQELNEDRDMAYGDTEHTIRQIEELGNLLNVKPHLWTDQEKEDFAEALKTEDYCQLHQGIKISEMKVNV